MDRLTQTMKAVNLSPKEVAAAMRKGKGKAKAAANGMGPAVCCTVNPVFPLSRIVNLNMSSIVK